MEVDRTNPTARQRADGLGHPWQDTRAVVNTQRNSWVLGARAGARTATSISVVPDTATDVSNSGSGRTNWNASEEYCNWGGGLYRRSFAGAEKGALPLGPPRAARGRKSSLSPVITVFLSPLLSKVLHRTIARFRAAPSGLPGARPKSVMTPVQIEGKPGAQT